MNPRALLLPVALLTALLSACAQPLNEGSACFQTSECRGGSICAETVYGNFCMKTCSPDLVKCANGTSCLESAQALGDLEGVGGSSGAGGQGGMGGDAGAGGAGGLGGIGGVGGAPPELWLCLPGQLESPDYFPKDIGFVCDFSIECVLGAVCVCIPGATCEGEGRNGPTCQRICELGASQPCPNVADLTPQCTDLGDGRGFCDPTTITLDP